MNIENEIIKGLQELESRLISEAKSEADKKKIENVLSICNNATRTQFSHLKNKKVLYYE